MTSELLGAGRVLLIGSNRERNEQLVSALRGLGVACVVAAKAGDAEHLLGAQRIEVAIVDSGSLHQCPFALAQDLMRSRHILALHLSVIVVADRIDQTMVVHAMRSGVADLVEVPISPAKLSMALQKIESYGFRDTLLDQLKHLGIELARLSSKIDTRNGDKAGAAAAGNIQIAESHQKSVVRYDDAAAWCARIRVLLKEAARRRAVAGEQLFGDPAWEMLLDLLLAQFEGRRVAVSSSCIASGAPISTALRLVGRLVDSGVLIRERDNTDRRRQFVSLAPTVAEELLEYVKSHAMHD